MASRERNMSVCMWNTFLRTAGNDNQRILHYDVSSASKPPSILKSAITRNEVE